MIYSPSQCFSCMSCMSCRSRSALDKCALVGQGWQPGSILKTYMVILGHTYTTVCVVTCVTQEFHAIQASRCCRKLFVTTATQHSFCWTVPHRIDVYLIVDHEVRREIRYSIHLKKIKKEENREIYSHIWNLLRIPETTYVYDVGHKFNQKKTNLF